MFIQSQADHTMFYKPSKEILMVYVDDIILVGDYDEMDKLKRRLAKEFEMKDLGVLKYLEWSLWGLMRELL